MSVVANIEADVAKYDGNQDFQVQCEYRDPTILDVIVKRVDVLADTTGWANSLQVLICDTNGNKCYVDVGASPSSNMKRISVHVDDVESCGEFVEHPDKVAVASRWRPGYQPYIPFEHFPQYVNLQSFNRIFSADISMLPASLYAVGIRHGGAYICRDSYGLHDWDYEIRQTVDFIFNVAFRRKDGPLDFYCVICALDGYVEGIYTPSSPRCIPRRVGDVEHRGEGSVQVKRYLDNEYPVFHKLRYVLAQSSRLSVPYCAPVVDRYCLHHMRYNLYRSVHNGVAFHHKIPAVVYAGGDRGSMFNFVHRRDIDVSQRKYFMSDKVDKTNVVAPGSIERADMVLYKYILDIDGNASTWDATAWKLNSGSVIFKTESDWCQWFYDEFKEGTHYVSIKDDFTDLQEKFAWCEANQDKCVNMVENCKRLFQRAYSHETLTKQIENIVMFHSIECYVAQQSG